LFACGKAACKQQILAIFPLPCMGKRDKGGMGV
jgi:hypothetical protein